MRLLCLFALQQALTFHLSYNIVLMQYRNYARSVRRLLVSDSDTAGIIAEGYGP